MVDTSGKPLITLPSVTYYKHEVTLEGEAQQLYREVEAEVSASVQQAMKEDSTKPSFTHIRTYLGDCALALLHAFTDPMYRSISVCLLLRLRQLACDSSLCPPDFIAE